MRSEEIRKKFLDFFEKRGHKIIPSASLVPENDPSVLFTTAGMQQFKSYYTGAKNAQEDFETLNTASVQKVVRTSDIEEVGDESHLTFFEMLGNFSFGGYFKEKAIEYGWDFIKNEMGLKIDYVTVFGGEDGIPADSESERIWNKLDPNIEVRKAGKADNFWGPTGSEGPCGPTTEIYVNGVEIWNIVFNEYYQNPDKTLNKLGTPGVDTGMGLERLLVQVGQKKDVYETDLFDRLLKEIESQRYGKNKMDVDPEAATRSRRIIADHLKAAVFMIADGLGPSNTGRGYILRRLIRRAALQSDRLGVMPFELGYLASQGVIPMYKDVYPGLEKEKPAIHDTIKEEERGFRVTLKQGLKEFEKGTDAFTLFSTYGFPLEMTLELARERGRVVDIKEFEDKFKAHQDQSRTSSAGMFKGGLANTNEQTIKLHTAHHLLLAALQEVLGKEVKQRGSNITEERLRMDFSFPRKLTAEELKEIGEMVNNHIEAGHRVVRREMPKIEAETIGAEMEFGAKYPDIVSIYFIEDEKGNIISKEFCGGPHVENTSKLGKFKILKEEAVSAGIRRIKARLE